MSTTSTPASLAAYPVEFDFPDISPYAEGNTGVPFVFTFDSGRPGKHVMIMSLTHGNEVSGAINVGPKTPVSIQSRQSAARTWIIRQDSRVYLLRNLLVFEVLRRI